MMWFWVVRAPLCVLLQHIYIRVLSLNGHMRKFRWTEKAMKVGIHVQPSLWKKFFSCPQRPSGQMTTTAIPRFNQYMLRCVAHDDDIQLKVAIFLHIHVYRLTMNRHGRFLVTVPRPPSCLRGTLWYWCSQIFSDIAAFVNTVFIYGLHSFSNPKFFFSCFLYCTVLYSTVMYLCKYSIWTTVNEASSKITPLYISHYWPLNKSQKMLNIFLLKMKTQTKNIF